MCLCKGGIRLGEAGQAGKASLRQYRGSTGAVQGQYMDSTGTA